MAILRLFKNILGEKPSEQPAELRNLNVSSVLTAHLAWTNRLRTHIMKKDAEGLVPEDISRDDLCELGKWLYGDAREFYGSLPSYGRLVDIHASFHRSCGRCAGAVVNGKSDEANVHLKTVRHMSSEVQNAITDLQQEANAPAA